MPMTDETEIDPEEYADEIEGLRRINERLKGFISWMSTVAFASVAFMFTLLLQLKQISDVPLPVFALTTLGLLLSGAALGILNRFIYEFSNLHSDLGDTGPLLNKLMEMGQKEGILNAKEEVWVTEWRTRYKKGDYGESPKPYIMGLVALQAFVSSVGVISLSAYLVTYLF